MVETITFILIFLVVIAIAALLFSAWLIVSLIKLAVSATRWLFSPRKPLKLHAPVQAIPLRALPPRVSETVICRNQLCVARNPAGSRFCRRCGQRQVQPVAVQVGRVAAW